MDAPIIFGLEGFRPNLSNPGPYTFSISLEGPFALRCRNLAAPSEMQGRFNEMGAKIIRDITGDRYRSPYSFVENSLLIGQCSLGNEGRWLTLDRDGLARLTSTSANVNYEGHNIDNPQQAIALLSLFATWAEYAGAQFTR